MKRLLITIFLLTAHLGGYCCKCDASDSVQEEFSYSDVVVYGQIISITKVSPMQTFDTTLLHSALTPTNTFYKAMDFLYMPLIFAVRLKVIEGFKGSKSGQIVTVFTPIAGASCGYGGFVMGQRFIVYGNIHSFYLDSLFSNYNSFSHLEMRNTFWTNQCSRTAEYTKWELLKFSSLRN